ncbi:unnamed protein product [Coregonus sp. 'balchen']|nr:unnamed protein product [Coregonus sp. 'balchen']
MEGFKPFGWYLTLVQFGFYSLFGLNTREDVHDHSISNGGDHGSIKHLTGLLELSYTGKRYNLADVLAALCMSLGLIWFTLADSKVAPNFNATGFVFLLHRFRHPVTTYGYAFFFSLTGYFGISFVLALIKLFGALVAVTVTTGRKAMTIVLSFMFFSKPFTFQYIWSGLLVLFGIFLNVYSKNKDKMKLPSLADLRNMVLTGKKVRLLSQNV